VDAESEAADQSGVATHVHLLPANGKLRTALDATETKTKSHRKDKNTGRSANLVVMQINDSICCRPSRKANVGPKTFVYTT
jgi:hypothetical protein